MKRLISFASLAILYGQSTVINTNNLDGYGNIVYRGERNDINGIDNQISGYQNQITGNVNEVYGDINDLKGHSNLVAGYGNQVSGSGNLVSGLGNIVLGAQATQEDKRKAKQQLLNILKQRAVQGPPANEKAQQAPKVQQQQQVKKNEKLEENLKKQEIISVQEAPKQTTINTVAQQNKSGSTDSNESILIKVQPTGNKVSTEDQNKPKSQQAFQQLATPINRYQKAAKQDDLHNTIKTNGSQNKQQQIVKSDTKITVQQDQKSKNQNTPNLGNPENNLRREQQNKPYQAQNNPPPQAQNNKTVSQTVQLPTNTVRYTRTSSDQYTVKQSEPVKTIQTLSKPRTANEYAASYLNSDQKNIINLSGQNSGTPITTTTIKTADARKVPLEYFAGKV